MQINQVALQLYTLRAHTADDMLGTLRKVAAMGYPAVELAGYGNATPAGIRTTLDECGMRAISAHVSLERLRNEQEQVFEELHTVGCNYVVVPSIPETQRSSVSAIQQVAHDLNQIGRSCSQQGFTFGYHNHAFEFTPVENTTMWDVLVSETDSDVVQLELDVFWAIVAGMDPLKLIKQCRGRLPLLHLKDMVVSEPPTDAPVGSGSLPWQDIIAAGDESGTQWYIVEQDHPQQPLDNAHQSIQYLQALVHR